MIAKSETTKIWAAVDTCKPHWHTLEWKFDCFVYWASDRYFEGKKHQMIVLSISSLESNVRSSFYYLTCLKLHTYIYIHIFYIMLFELMARASLSITVCFRWFHNTCNLIQQKKPVKFSLRLQTAPMHYSYCYFILSLTLLHPRYGVSKALKTAVKINVKQPILPDDTTDVGGEFADDRPTKSTLLSSTL